MSDQEPGPTHTPYGQPGPYGQQGQPSPYGGQGQPSYGAPAGQGDRRPGTVTAAAWITIVFSGLTAVLFGFAGLALLVARDQVITEMERVPEFQDAGIDADAAVGVLVAFILGLVVWAVIALVLAVFVLRRSNVARILLVISSSVVALLSLLGITSGVSVITLIASVATIVLLFVGGAGDWFARKGSPGGYPGGGYPSAGHPGAGYGTDPYGTGSQGGDTYGSNPYATQPPPEAPRADNPYGQPPSSDNPYGQPPSDGSDHPPRDYPGR
ncbi:hypothetical protein GCM10009641_76590 [Mycobacterium cookii]|uniref:Integral membrane protein n=1 Tax=Nocardioides furvisabuli TaxID=375542 RepID=A0ABN2XFH6_9ACTN|nr:hypothetical protein [Nocardioides furvisabuli]